MKQVSVHFADSEHKGLSVLSEQLERSINDFVRDAVREYLETRGSTLR